jgi:misacylated tRNA(Ala) deacylase
MPISRQPWRTSAASSSSARFICPLGGGQLGKSGLFVRQSGESITIIDTRKDAAPDSVLHIPAAGASRPQLGECLTLERHGERRYSLMRLYTALHLFSGVMVAPMSGGTIAPGRARPDFDTDMALLEVQCIARDTNALIASAVATETLWITDARAEFVKTMSVQPPRGARPCAAREDTGHRPATVQRHPCRQHRADRRHSRHPHP